MPKKAVTSPSFLPVSNTFVPISIYRAKKKNQKNLDVSVVQPRIHDPLSEPGYWENPDTRTHKVSLDHYRRESMKIIQLLKEGLPTGEVGE